MKIINEIRSMALLDAQKLVVDLRTNVRKTDKDYALAQEAINIATGRKDWSEPATMEVRNVAGHDLKIDDVKIAKGQTGKLYHWQYIALCRFLEPVNESDHQDAVKACVRKPVAGENAERSMSRDEIISLIKANGISEGTLSKAITNAMKSSPSA